MDQTDIYAILKSHTDLSNSESNTLAQTIWSKVVKYGKDIEKIAIREEREKAEANKKNKPVVRRTAEERKEMLEIKLDAMLEDPKTSAADIKEFRDYFGLGGKKSDIIIETIDYKDVYPEDADVIAVTAELIRKSIEKANEQLHT